MGDNRKLSIAITTRDNFEALLDSLNEAMDDERISDILILNNASDEDNTWKLHDWLEFDAPKKVRLATNGFALDETQCEKRAIVLADMEYVLVTTAETAIQKKDVDKIYFQEWNPDINLQPSPNIRFLNRATYIKNEVKNNSV